MAHERPKELWVKALVPPARAWLRAESLPAELAAHETAVAPRCRAEPAALSSLVDWLRQTVPEQRDLRGLRHQQATVLALVFLAIASGMRGGYRGPAVYAQGLSQAQRRRLRCWKNPRTRRYEAPSEGTFFRVLTSVPPALVAAALRAWQHQRLGRPPDEPVAIDGKALRGSGGVQLLGAMGHESGRWLAVAPYPLHHPSRSFPVTGRIFDIQRFSIHDGPGIRTTVFLMGCPLRCQWCHNPEGQSGAAQISFVAEKCIGCGYCAAACRQGAHQIQAGQHSFERGKCLACGECTTGCHTGALECIGREITVDEALATALRDEPFYRQSGGGLTISGGEPLMQLDFTAELLRAAKAAGLHCAVETCGYANEGWVERLQPLVDLFLYDLKETDPARHREFTGVDSARILANLHALHDAGSAVLLRLPIVPGLNDRLDHFTGIATLARRLPRLVGVEVMPYHRLGSGKQQRLGQPDPLPDIPAPNSVTVDGWVAALRHLGVPVLNA